MFHVIEKHLPLSLQGPTSGFLKTPLDKLLMLSQLRKNTRFAELFLEWEDQYIHLILSPGILTAAYSKQDEFQFGRLLSQIASLSQEEIDEAYRKIHVQQPVSASASEPQDTGQSRPSSQRIGSLLVAAHVISPHMIGMVLRSQIIERCLRVFSLKELKFTYEPKTESKSSTTEQAEQTEQTVTYPYLDPTVRADEVIFQALLWRTSMTAVNELVDFFKPHQPMITLPADFVFQERLSVICRLTPKQLEKEVLAPVRGKPTSLEAWMDLRPKQRAFMMRFVAAFLLSYTELWKSRA